MRVLSIVLFKSQISPSMGLLTAPFFSEIWETFKINMLIYPDDTRLASVRCVFSCLCVCHRVRWLRHFRVVTILTPSSSLSLFLTRTHTHTHHYPTPRRATGGMLRLVFSHSLQAVGLQQAEIWSGPCLNMCFSMGVFGAALTAETLRVFLQPLRSVHFEWAQFWFTTSQFK